MKKQESVVQPQVKTREEKKKEERNESKIFAGVTTAPTEQSLKAMIIEMEREAEIHPRIKQYVFELNKDRYQTSNQVCIAALKAIQAFLKDFHPTQGGDFNRELINEWTRTISLIKRSS